MSAPETCSVAAGACLQPAGWRAGLGGIVENTGPFRELPECHQCGNPVCLKCSLRRKRKGKWVRICLDCIGEATVP
jgi:hypothetical protein